MSETFVDPFKVQQIRVAVDAVCITEENEDKYLLLIKREYEPFKGKWALPGGFLKEDEDLEVGAVRELKEESNIQVEINPQRALQVGAYGALDRDPRPRRIVSVAYLIQLEEKYRVSIANETLDVQWVKVSDLDLNDLAFDHKLIVEDALALLNKAQN